MSATEGNGWVLVGQPTRGRACGGCQACCKALPVELVPDMVKPANTRCPHQCARGCAIYDERPEPCQYWSCRWLFDPDTAAMKRPDKTGYIVDCVTDTIFLNGEPFSALQVWVDPERREAWRDPALRDYVERIAERFGYPTMVRWSPKEGMAWFAPCLTNGLGWIERTEAVNISEEETERRVGGREARFLPR